MLNYVKANGDLAALPNGMHTVIPAKPDQGLPAGAIFTLRNRNDGVNVNQHNRLHPYYLVYVDVDGNVVANYTEVKPLLDLVRANCKVQSHPLLEVCKQFNKDTADGRKMGIYSELLSSAIKSMIDVNEEKDLDSLFTSGKTTALVNAIAGIDEFELVAFIVVQG